MCGLEMACAVSLSRRQVKLADRVGGCELILPWPEWQSLGPALAEDQERDATRAEHAAAEQIIGAAAHAAGLVPVRSVVRHMKRPTQLPRGDTVEQHLIVLLIGQRWVHATGRPQPAQAWHSIERLSQR